MLSPPARDETPAFFADLQAGVPLRVLAAPAAVARIPEFRCFLGYLRSLGARSFHAVLPRADIAAWVYYRLLREASGRPLIVSACAGVNSRLRGSGMAAARHLPAVPSPLVCAAIYLRKYRGYKERFAFLSPCAFKWTEFSDGNGGRLIHYNATIRGIRAYLAEKAVQLSACEPADLDEEGPGLTVAAYGGFGAALARVLPLVSFRVVMGLREVLAALSGYGGEAHGDCPVIEPYACAAGCEGGSGVDGCQAPAESSGERASGGSAMPGPEPSRTDLLDLFSRYDRDLDPADFITPGGRGYWPEDC